MLVRVSLIPTVLLANVLLLCPPALGQARPPDWTTIPLLTGTDSHGLAYDAARERVVLFGGWNASGDTWEWDGVQWICTTPRHAPSPRTKHGMAYDPQRQRVVLFGGDTGSLTNTVRVGDTWEWDGKDWRRAATTGPSSRTVDGGMAWDGNRGRVVLFGGDDGSRRNDQWEWDGASWTQIPLANRPVARANHALAYDERRARLVLYGGTDAAFNRLGDTWEWDGTSWTQLTPPTNPGLRAGHALAYDAAAGLVVLFGDSRSGIGETWTWDGRTWARTAPPRTPPDLWGVRMAFDAARSRIVMFGGSGDSSTWLWDGRTWQSQAPSSPTWPGPMAYDSTRQTVILWHFDAAETWAWDGRSWRKRSPSVAPPSDLVPAGTAFDSARARVVLVGDRNGATETWEWDGVLWQPRSPATSPPARTGGRLTYDSSRGRVVLFGGRIGSTIFRDTWEYDGVTWSQGPASPAPSPRWLASLVCDSNRGRVVLFGGNDGNQWLNDTWEWDGNTWQRVAPSASPPPLFFAMTAYDAARRRVVLTGYQMVGGTPQPSETWEYDGSTWVRQSTTIAPTPNVGHSMVYDAARGHVLRFSLVDGTVEYGIHNATWRTLGHGCVGSAGVPTLNVVDGARPWVGTTLDLRISSLPPGHSAFLALGGTDQTWAGLPLPYDLSSIGATGCSVFADLEALAPLPTQAGNLTFPLRIPNDPGLVDVPVFAQTLVLDPAANAAGLSLSNAAVATIGRR